MTRSFEDVPAVREKVPLLLGLVGPSGSGKTYSALELATGIQEESGGDIYGIDTEGRRMLHYADRFKFRHIDFKAPFGPLDYLAAVEHCARQGCRTLIIDSQSHEHEGAGGVLEMHEAETERLSKGDAGKRDKVKFLAWVKPKADRRQLLSGILQLNMNVVFCFRAKEKLRLVPGKDPVNLGWQAIAGEEYVYEMTLALLLPPGSGGVPDLSPAEVGEKALVKVPAQFRPMIQAGKPLDRRLGRELAAWAAGGASRPGAAPPRSGAELLAVAKERTKGDRAAYGTLLARILPAGKGSSAQQVALAWELLASDPEFGDPPPVGLWADAGLVPDEGDLEAENIHPLTPEPGTDQVAPKITPEEVAEIREFATSMKLDLDGSGGLLETVVGGPLEELTADEQGELWGAMRAAVRARKGKG